MRSRIPLLALFFAIGSFALPQFAHAAIPFFGPIIPDAYNVCPASWGLLVTVINNIIEFSITIAIVFVAPIMIAYSGFLYVVNPANPGGIAKAKSILSSTVIGIIVAIAGWAIVDAVMAVFYHPSDSAWGTWSSLITSGNIDPCIDLAKSLNQTSSGMGVTGVSATGSLKPPPSGKAGTACDPAVVQAGAAAGGYALSPTQANIFACIAAPESTCGTDLNPPNKKWNTGVPGKPASTAAGAFQVLLKTNSQCYENTACYTAAGVSGNLNCASGFDNVGNPKPGSAVVQKCVRAAANLNCSASAAACLLQQNKGSFSPWQADIKSARQTGCITSGG